MTTTTRGEARELILERARALGRRHGLAGVPSILTQHNVDYLTRLVQGQAGLAACIRGVVGPFEVGDAYDAAYHAALRERVR